MVGEWISTIQTAPWLEEKHPLQPNQLYTCQVSRKSQNIIQKQIKYCLLCLRIRHLKKYIIHIQIITSIDSSTQLIQKNLSHPTRNSPKLHQESQHLGTRCPGHSSPGLPPWIPRRPRPCRPCTCPVSSRNVDVWVTSGEDTSKPYNL